MEDALNAWMPLGDKVFRCQSLERLVAAMPQTHRDPRRESSCAITRRALGRSARIGDLYDVAQDGFWFQSVVTDADGKQGGDQRIPVVSGRNICQAIAETLPAGGLQEHLSLLDVERELQASVVTKLCKPTGHAEILDNFNDCERVGTVFLQLPTEYTILDLTKCNVEDLVTDSNGFATHIVTGVQWGICATASVLTSDVDDSALTQQIMAEIKVEVQRAEEMLNESETRFKARLTNAVADARLVQPDRCGPDPIPLSDSSNFTPESKPEPEQPQHEGCDASNGAAAVADECVSERDPRSSSYNPPATAALGASVPGVQSGGEGEQSPEENGLGTKSAVGLGRAEYWSNGEPLATTGHVGAPGARLGAVGEPRRRTVENDHHQQNTIMRYRLDFRMDGVPWGVKAQPETVGEAVAAMQRDASRGENVVPIAYTLRPLQDFLGNRKTQGEKGDEWTEDLVSAGQIVEIFHEFDRNIGVLRATLRFVECNRFCVPDSYIEGAANSLDSSLRSCAQMREQICELLMCLRRGKNPKNGADPICDLEDCRALAKHQAVKVEEYERELTLLRQKVDLVQWFVSLHGAERYVGRGGVLDIAQLQGFGEAYVFFATFDRYEVFAMNVDIFDSLMNTQEGCPAFVVVDLQVSPNADEMFGFSGGNRVVKFENGEVKDSNLLRSEMDASGVSYVRYFGKNRAVDATKPQKRGIAHLVCPFSQQAYPCCSNVKREWTCIECRHRIEYGFDGSFYCFCGSAPINGFRFLCFHKQHPAGEFATFERLEILRSLAEATPPLREVNILILGETGVGKTTWINAFANYLTHKDLAEAQASRPVCLIPTQFSVTDATYEEVVVRVGEDSNEVHSTGASSTQAPQAHTFQVDREIIRLIDTPGIGDTRGPEQDRENFADILRYLSNHTVLHGVCILLKPNNAKLNVIFKYCINELLSQLHKSAAGNIVFCFTNARSTFYRPGDTIGPLKAYLKDLNETSGVQIPLSQDRIYCMDNEAFRFLCCTLQGIEFPEEQHRLYADSWAQADAESRRLLRYISQIRPHRTNETITLNEARTTILTISKPLSDIRKLIAGNMAVINDKIDEISRLTTKDKDFLSKVFVSKMGIRQTPLNYPRTVCTASECVDTKAVENTSANQTVYKTHCHERCYLENVTPDRFPNPDLQKCWAMGWFGKPCRHCGHTWDLHMHIWYSQEQVTELVRDPDVEEAIAKNKSDTEIQRLAVAKLQAENEAYIAEQAVIDQVCAKFGSFLKRNAIKAYNDVIEDYLQLNIREARRLLAAPAGGQF